MKDLSNPPGRQSFLSEENSEMPNLSDSLQLLKELEKLKIQNSELERHKEESQSRLENSLILKEEIQIIKADVVNKTEQLEK